MIKIKMHEGSWRIHIEDEILEFKTKKEFDGFLNRLLEIKEKYGRLKEYDERSGNKSKS